MEDIRLSFEDVAGSLERKAAAQETVTYNDFAAELGLRPVNNLFSNHPLKLFFEQIDADDAMEQRPFRTAVVVARSSGIPGKGFFKSLQLHRNIKVSTADEASVWRVEMDELTEYYGPNRPKTTLQIQLSPAQSRRLVRLCERGNQAPAELVERTFSYLLNHLESLSDAIDEAHAQIERGEVFSHEEVFAELYKEMGWKDNHKSSRS